MLLEEYNLEKSKDKNTNNYKEIISDIETITGVSEDSKTERKLYGDEIQVVSFFVENEIYSIDILNIQEVTEYMDITIVPNMPEFVKGVINLRGNIVGVLDIAPFLGLKLKDEKLKSKIIIINKNSLVFGILVDRIYEVLETREALIKKMNDTFNFKGAGYLKGLFETKEKMIALLDLEALLADEKIKRIRT